jgi:hypothetical protein
MERAQQMMGELSICRRQMAQLRGMMVDLKRQQNEAISDMFKTVLFRMNVKRIDSSKH